MTYSELYRRLRHEISQVDHRQYFTLEARVTYSESPVVGFAPREFLEYDLALIPDKIGDDDMPWEARHVKAPTAAGIWEIFLARVLPALREYCGMRQESALIDAALEEGVGGLVAGWREAAY